VPRTPFKPVLLQLLQQAYLDQKAFVRGLTDVDRAAVGAAHLWSARDHVAHLTFWRQRLVAKLSAILNHDVQPESGDIEQLNARVFEEQRERPWSDMLMEAERAHAETIAHIDRLSERDLITSNRFDWIPEAEPLYTVIMGFTYEHGQQHLAQFHLDRDGLPEATELYETWAARVVESSAPRALKGILLYNLACFYAIHAELDEASRALQRVLALYPGPRLREWLLSDPDLVALRSPSG
jgi:tetratricopeptide (TPR) repeat protein